MFYRCHQRSLLNSVNFVQVFVIIINRFIFKYSMAEYTGRKQTAISLKTKIELLKEVDENRRSKTEICKMFGIANSTLSTIIKNRDTITAMFERSIFEPERKRMRTAKHEALETALLIWLNEARSENAHISGPVLLEKADEFAIKLGIQFSANPGWLERFKKRNGIVLKNLTASRIWSSGTASREEDKKDPIPLEPAIEIKEEPLDYNPTLSTSTDTNNAEFILPHEESNTWTPPVPPAPETVVEPQFTLSVASLAIPNNPEISEAEQLRKKRKISKTSTLVPTTNGSEVRAPSPMCNIGEPSSPGSLKEPRKDQFDVFGEYIAAKLRSLDRRSCAYAQKAIGDIIFEAEIGKFLEEESDSKDLKICAS